MSAPRGLPHALPAGEALLWQGAPRFGRLLVSAFRIRLWLVYVGLLVAWGGISSAIADHSTAAGLAAATWCVALGAVPLLLLVAFAGLTARSTVYTITSRRVVIAHGAAIRKHLNLPFTAIDAAGLRRFADGTGDIPLTPRPDARLSYLLLWPHVRAGRGARAMPMLRAVPEAEAVAACLADALTAHGVAPRLLVAPIATPAATQAPLPAIEPAGAHGEASPA